MTFIKSILVVLVCMIAIPNAYAQTKLPANAVIYLPVLKEQIGQVWPTLTQPQDMAGQIEQETCISLTWPSCWNPHTELKTSREYGFGLGQLTVTASFNNFTALQKMNDPTIKTWKWEDRYDPAMQIRAQLDMDLLDYNFFKPIALTDTDNLAFMFSAYNGGIGGLEEDIRYCTALPNCNHRVWFGNVELNSLKAKTKLGSAYGTQTPYGINRGYVTNVLTIRSQKYILYFKAN